jgi:phytoene dehydrogenase-like protein
MEAADVVVIGAGLAGLTAALDLAEEGLTPLVLEASDGVGGRVRTDVVDGFRLDRGFQVFLEAYPEARRRLDYGRLDLRPFVSGARVWLGDELHPLADPLRQLSALPGTLTAPVGSVADKLRVWKLRRRALAPDSLPELFSRSAGSPATAYDELRELGFSRPMIDSFFRPFLGGIQLDRSLSFDGRLMDFVIRMMASGDISVPAEGMGAIPAQLAAKLKRRVPGAVRLASPVESIEPGGVKLGSPAGGAMIEAERIVVATDPRTAERLLAGTGAGEESADDAVAGGAPDPRGSTCLWYASSTLPFPGPWLLLDGLGEGPVNSVAVMSQVAPTYAPAGSHLMAVAVLGVSADGDAELDAAVRRQLGDWFGRQVGGWDLLRVDRIPYAQPAQLPGYREGRVGREAALSHQGLYLAGDWLETASIQGAMTSGRRAAEAILRDRERR